ncbi:hypothetical protein P154DRAFT_36289 [Amniculicola lignicola CBS 123094]|uniref:Uncharacterized protein n=1 Tax=Amniculicola lignicola CBS 123094 TaxID=1392246 RepID=A0A6A5WS39_9PLEO|nr:hypothetical protein P154DRAFT_36289 [Amniculicola lignicola CBS 123094]
MSSPPPPYSSQSREAVPPYSPRGRPTTSRQGSMLSPIITSFPSPSSQRCDSAASSPYKDVPERRIRNQDSLIFVNATIPLSPTAPNHQENTSAPYDGVAPRKRSGFARLFCCFGREERARRRAVRMEWNNMSYEKVGEDIHWTEL